MVNSMAKVTASQPAARANAVNVVEKAAEVTAIRLADAAPHKSLIEHVLFAWRKMQRPRASFPPVSGPYDQVSLILRTEAEAKQRQYSNQSY